jgi:glycosyltransferase involved in cell wall biosynthesis
MVRGMPFIISEQWSGFLKERRAFNGIKARIGRWLASHSERITTNSQGLRQGMLDYGFTTAIDVIPNVVDTSLFVPRAQILSEGRKRIMHISRLDSHPKNLPGILRAIKMLRTIRDDFELHLIGTGAEEEDQKRLAQSLGIADIVVFHGHKNHKDVADLLSRSCFLVMFSNYETQCCAILEAFACGLPVITTRSGGMTELLDPSRGILVEVGDEKGLANAMDKMLDTYTEYDPPSIRKFVEDGFTPPFIGHQFSELYKSIDQI